ncbi:MAG: radical SAM protein [Termitinemataceae bacterium]|nr:MAG: radical SAM protein [Termitinemataceae bacterium]
MKLAAACLHFGEEPPITGEGGSGAIFISGCNLRCVFCQNHQISHKGMGRTVSKNEFADICLRLQNAGAENINIVTGSHVIPAVKEGMEAGRAKGLHIPLYWNSSAYEAAQDVEMIDTFANGYLPDLKTLDINIAKTFFNAPDYPDTAKAAIKAMIKSGKPVIVRHLVLPGFLDASKDVLQWIACNASDNVQVSLMTQYTPLPGGPSRFLNDAEYDQLLKWIDLYGIDGYYQEKETGDDWLPDFANPKPFSSDLCKMLWHWKEAG